MEDVRFQGGSEEKRGRGEIFVYLSRVEMSEIGQTNASRLQNSTNLSPIAMSEETDAVDAFSPTPFPMCL